MRSPHPYRGWLITVVKAMRWKLIEEWPDYAVSDTGLIKRATDSRLAPAGFILSPARINGYPVVWLSQRGQKRQWFYVHRLVARHFLGPQPSPSHLVCHNNGARDDNRAENLRWDTQHSNLGDRKRHGTELRGDRNGRSKLTASQVLDIRRRYKRRHPIHGAAAMAKEFGVSDVAIIKAFRGENWSQL
jgi:hypothetical protein